MRNFARIFIVVALLASVFVQGQARQRGIIEFNSIAELKNTPLQPQDSDFAVVVSPDGETRTLFNYEPLVTADEVQDFALDNFTGAWVSVGAANGITSDPDPQTNLAAIAQEGDVVYDSTDKELQVFNGTEFVNPAQSDAQAQETANVAAGSTLGLQQQLLAADGQVGLNVLGVGLTNTDRVQGVSLGNGNVVITYANGEDFNNRLPMFERPEFQALGYTGPEFMEFGEVICFTDLPTGAIIESTQGFYGGSENVSGNAEAVMPLLSFGLSTTDTFMFSFRQSNRTQDNHAFAFILNGPNQSDVDVTFGDGTPIADVPTRTLAPWEFSDFHLDGNTEYRIRSTNPIMICTAAGFDNADYTSPAAPIGLGPRDARLILPTSNDVITHPRFGQISGPFANTGVQWFDVEGDEGSFTVTPGSPVDIQVATGNANTDYRPVDFTRFRASGLIIGNSGADGAGGDATPAVPVSTMSQVVAQPFWIGDSGNGDQSSVTIFSPFEGTAEYWTYNTTTEQAELLYTVPLNRQGVTVASGEDQFHPAAGQISNEPDAGVIPLVGILPPGVVVADVPIAVISQSNTILNTQVRSQGGTMTTTIVNDDDETLMFGINPTNIRMEARENVNGILYRRQIDANGNDIWIQN